MKLIAQDFTGSDINNYYPFNHGHQILKKVLYDPTYGNSGCYVDFSKIEIFRDTNGDFLQPKYLSFRTMKTLAPHLLKEQFSARLYPVVHLLHRLYRIIHNKEEVRDWCTHEVVLPHLKYFSFIYTVPMDCFQECLYQTLLETTRDALSLTDATIKEDLVVEIVGSAGKEMENLWNRVKLAL